MKTGPSNPEEINALYPLHIRRFASGQYLSSLAYYLATLSTMPASIKVLNVDGSFKKYHIQAFPLKKGMYAYLLLPEDKSSKNVKVIFRGTDFDDHKSVAINLESQGPGTASFEIEKDKIFNQLKSAIQSHYGKATDGISLDVSGHSQGAAFSQLFVTEFLNRRETDDDLEAIDALNMTILNSPGVPHAIAKSANESAFFNHFFRKPIKILANFGLVGGDAVQVTGHDTIFATLQVHIAEVNLLKINKGLEGAWIDGFYLPDGISPTDFADAFKKLGASVLGAHSNVNFYAPTDDSGKITVNSDYNYYTNKNTKDIEKLRYELLYKAVRIQNNYLIHLLKIFGHHIVEHKDTYANISPKRTIEEFLFNSFVYSMYQKMAGWFRSSSPDKPQFEINTANILMQINPSQDSQTQLSARQLIPIFEKQALANKSMREQCIRCVSRVATDDELKSGIDSIKLG